MGLLSEGLRFSASFEPLGDSPEPPQVRTRERGFEGATGRLHDAEKRKFYDQLTQNAALSKAAGQAGI